MADAFLTYNGITLSCLHTQRVEQTAVYDESGADQLYTKVVLTVGAVFNSTCAPVALGESPGQAMSRVRHMLLLPRQNLVFAPCGDTLFTVAAPDDANGPEPKACTISAITPATWDVSFTIEFCIRDCPEGDASRAWLSLKWEETITFDENWFAVKKRSGLLILSSRDPSRSGPNGYRGLVTPDVPNGFRRKSAQYHVVKNGLGLRFDFVDVELAEPPPAPALKLTGRMVVSVPLPGGQYKAEISLRLTGSRTTSKQDLMAAAIRAAMGRVNATGIDRQKGTGKILIGGAIEEDLDDERKAVGLTLTWNIKPSATGWFSSALGAALAAVGAAQPPGRLGADFNWVGQPLAGSVENRGIAPSTDGTAFNVRLLAAALNDPCSRSPQWENAAKPPKRTPVSPGGNGSEGQGADGAFGFTTEDGTAVSIAYGDDLSHATAGYDDFQGLYIDDGPGVYETYVITCHYFDDPGVTVRPSTKPGGKAVALSYHAGIRKLRVEFTATKIGDRPTIPFKDPGDPNIVWESGNDSVAGIDLAADGVNQRFTVTGIYNYAFLDGSQVVEAAPLPPFISRRLRLSAGTSAGRAAEDITFPADEGSNTFDETGITIVDLSQGAGGDWGGGGQPVYP